MLTSTVNFDTDIANIFTIHKKSNEMIKVVDTTLPEYFYNGICVDKINSLQSISTIDLSTAGVINLIGTVKNNGIDLAIPDASEAIPGKVFMSSGSKTNIVYDKTKADATFASLTTPVFTGEVTCNSGLIVSGSSGSQYVNILDNRGFICSKVITKQNNESNPPATSVLNKGETDALYALKPEVFTDEAVFQALTSSVLGKMYLLSTASKKEVYVAFGTAGFADMVKCGPTTP